MHRTFLSDICIMRITGHFGTEDETWKVWNLWGYCTIFLYDFLCQKAVSIPRIYIPLIWHHFFVAKSDGWLPESINKFIIFWFPIFYVHVSKRKFYVISTLHYKMLMKIIVALPSFLNVFNKINLSYCI